MTFYPSESCHFVNRNAFISDNICYFNLSDNEKIEAENSEKNEPTNFDGYLYKRLILKTFWKRILLLDQKEKTG